MFFSMHRVDFLLIFSQVGMQKISVRSNAPCIAVVHQNGLSCRTGAEFWDHILDLISGFGSADRNVVKNDHDYEFFIIVTVICLRLWCRLSIKQSWNCVNENPSIYVTCGRTQYRHLFHNREFHNINCRFCGAFLGCEGQI